MKSILLGSAIALAALGSAHAGPFSDFENAYRQMYGSYRTALFKTNSGDQAGSANAIEKFSSQFADLESIWADAPPPQYADDPLWGETLSEAAQMVAAAKAKIDAADLANAHITLEGVREVFGDLHDRNGIETFSDRMNAYHAEMEELLGLDMSALDDAMIGDVREHAAVMAYLANDVLAMPPAEAKDNAEFAKLADAFKASVANLLDAARSGNPEAIKSAVAAVKKPYSILFVKFG